MDVHIALFFGLFAIFSVSENLIHNKIVESDIRKILKCPGYTIGTITKHDMRKYIDKNKYIQTRYVYYSFYANEKKYNYKIVFFSNKDTLPENQKEYPQVGDRYLIAYNKCNPNRISCFLPEYQISDSADYLRFISSINKGELILKRDTDISQHSFFSSEVHYLHLSDTNIK